MTFLLNPKKYDKEHPDDKTREIMTKTIEFFEDKGLSRLRKEDLLDHFYDDYLQFWKKNQVLATLLTPSGYGAPDSRFDLNRVCEYNEIQSFYCIAYQYAYQVSVLGMGPLWMSDNEAIKQRTAKALQDGHIMAFGLSEKDHGADIYSNSMKLKPLGDGKYRADGSKYYIGNCNKAGIVSTMGRYADTDDYVFFAVDSQHDHYKLVKQIRCTGGGQGFVGEYRLIDYPISEDDIMSSGTKAWDACLSAINIGKFMIGFSSIGAATHAFYEALDHAHNRVLYGKAVTNFPHIRKSFIESYVRLIAMKSFALRSTDYFRQCSETDRRYLLFNPIQKYKVSSQAETVVGILHNVIAAKGFEHETYFSDAVVQIGTLPRLEGTTHVNLMQIIKFMGNYFFKPIDYPEVGRRTEAGDDSNVFKQFAGKTSTVTFHDYQKAYNDIGHLPNVKIFNEKIEIFKEMLQQAAPDKAQYKNVDHMLNIGEIFSLIVYGNIIAENFRFNPMATEIIDRLYEVLCRDIAEFAFNQFLNFNLTADQEKYFQALMKKPVLNADQDQKIWEDHILPLVGSYTMNP